MSKSTPESLKKTAYHELGHAWFGNLLTCASEGDMWINEGGATFCEIVAKEAMTNRAAATQYYLDKLRKVLLTAHKELSTKKGLTVCKANELIQEVFDVTGFSDILNIK